MKTEIPPKFNRGKIFVLSAPSGAGKTTLINVIKHRFPFLQESISYTTRKPRENEIHGIDYYFTTKNDFKQKIEEDYFIEWAEVHGNLYGTPRKLIDEKLENKEYIICDIDIQGAMNMKKAFPDDAVLIFVLPPDMKELEKRLLKRASDHSNVVQKRMENARKEVTYYHNYKYIIVNDDIDHASQLLTSILNAEIYASTAKNIEIIQRFL